MRKTLKKFTKALKDKREEVYTMRMKFLKNLSQKVEGLEEKTDRIEQKLYEMQTQMKLDREYMFAKFEKIDTRFDSIEGLLLEIITKIDGEKEAEVKEVKLKKLV